MDNKDIIKEVTRQVKEVCITLQRLDPIQILKKAYFEFTCQYLEKETESSIGREQIHSLFLVEYLQSLFLSIDLSKHLRSPTKNEWEEIKKKVASIYDTCLMPPPSIIPQFNLEKDLVLFSKILFFWHIRGKRYTQYESEHLNDLLEPHNEILKELYQITVKEIAVGVEKLILNTHSSLNILKNHLIKNYKEFNFSYNHLKKENLSKEIFNKSLQNKIKKSKKEIEKLTDDLFNVEKITKWPINFIRKLSAYSGSDKSFLTKGKYPGTPFQRLPIMNKPFFENNSKFYLFSPYALQNLYRNIQFSILEDKPNYSNKWNKRQSDVSEELPFKILKKIIGQNDKIKNFQYKIKGYPKNQSWFECDGIILFENWLIVIEVKAGKASYQPPIQNIDLYVEAVKKLLANPATQGRRFIETLKKEKELKLYDKKKGECYKNYFYR